MMQKGFRTSLQPGRSNSMEINQEDLAIGAVCRELAKVFSGEIDPRHLPDLKAELLVRLRELARRTPRREHP
ncbi:hypothetical protein [uncultured Bradyrhizobium sp.]|uniref:hypothetical protein n=1 Tax=uncultured Bradyrhizobium sp. TaxID=199684 RepID=UPI002608F801|nr:hypothetical protein [uncultured Bradyrhizobium sp.]